MSSLLYHGHERPRAGSSLHQEGGLISGEHSDGAVAAHVFEIVGAVPLIAMWLEYLQHRWSGDETDW